MSANWSNRTLFHGDNLGFLRVARFATLIAMGMFASGPVWGDKDIHSFIQENEKRREQRGVSHLEVWEAFGLWTKCSQIDLYVHVDDEATLGLTKEKVSTAVRSRLRAARLYDETAYFYLSVTTQFQGRSFIIAAKLYKFLVDAISGDGTLAPSWETSSFGTHGNDAGYVMSALSEHIDEFIGCSSRMATVSD